MPANQSAAIAEAAIRGSPPELPHLQPSEGGGDVSRERRAIASALGWGYSFVDLKDREEPEKVEGDKRTPAGFFRIGASFGFAPSRRPGYIELKGGETVCVEDPTSPFYNTITKRSEIGSVEADDMRSSPFYRSGLFVDYPSDRATQRRSCIFIHIWP